MFRSPNSKFFLAHSSAQNTNDFSKEINKLGRHRSLGTRRR